jgi:hypothetical protein
VNSGEEADDRASVARALTAERPSLDVAERSLASVDRALQESRMETIELPYRQKSRGTFLVDIWQVDDDWHWCLTNGKRAPSNAYPTREAAIAAARSKNGLDPNV